MESELFISHGLFKTYTGSSKLVSNDKVVYVTVDGPYVNVSKEGEINKLELEIKCSLCPSDKAYEGMCIKILETLVNSCFIQDCLEFKCLTISVISNAQDLSLICNAVSVACLDAGIPIKNTLYCAGVNSLIAFGSDGNIAFYHGITEQMTDALISKAKEETEYIKESILYAFKDVFNIN